MLLESILEGSQSSKISIIQETSNVRAEPILLKLLRNRIKISRIDLVNVICFQHNPNFFTGGTAQSNKILVHDGYTDPLGWNADQDSIAKDQTNVQGVNLETNLISRIKKLSKEHLKRSEVKIAVFIDGLSFLLRHKGIHDVCTLIKSMSNLKNKVDVVEIVATVQKDLVSTRDINAVKYIADAVIDLEPHRKETQRSKRGSQIEQTSFEADVTVKKMSGKILREVSLYSVSKELNFMKQNTNEISIANEDVPSQADPTAHLPFNLKLTESEKQARSQVKLPYTLDYEQKVEQLDSSSKSGQIIYHPDEADDFDEEDPDEDLDI